jgi:23S rRNA pseudouridine955/2504/2580 synthase
MTRPAPYHVSTDDDGLRLDQWCKKRLPALPYGLMQKLIRKGAIRVDGKKTSAKASLSAGQVVTIPADIVPAGNAQAKPPGSFATAKQADALQRCFIHEDAQRVVLNKPAGLAVQGGSQVRDSVDARLQRLAETPESRLRLTHRLDKDTSGILLLARSRTEAARLTEAFRSRDARKIYWALVVGTPTNPVGVMDVPLGKRYHQGREKMSVVVDQDAGQQALTHYRVIASSACDRFSWVELRPVTGRTHQLRVHMQAMGHPIFGDGKYGGQAAFADGEPLPQQLHLHSRFLDLSQAGINLQVSAPLPAHMQESWHLLGLPDHDDGVSLLEFSL